MTTVLNSKIHSVALLGLTTKGHLLCTPLEKQRHDASEQVNLIGYFVIYTEWHQGDAQRSMPSKALAE